MGAMKMDAAATSPLTDNAVAPFAIEGAPVRGRLARLGSAIDEVLTRHDYPEAVANLLGEACTLAEYAPEGLTGNMVFGQPAIYAKGLEQAVALLEGEEIEKEQYFPPLEITEENAADYCIADKPSNFQLGYDFPGLDLTLDEVMEFYSGS